ncbi:MAG: AAA family ATPase [Deltaproteobacteria bacterium]|nr:AAA family ATPase [Deltaproteobacteria bacterium]
MKFSAVVEQVLEMLQRQGRVSYRALKREFELDNDYIEDLKEEIIKARRLAIDEDGAVLVWTGGGAEGEKAKRGKGEKGKDFGLRTSDSGLSAGERRQLTVMFCDVVGSTTLSAQLDPEELRAVMQAYQQACVDVITRFDGHVAKYLGDGLLAYFGYPTAHEDDAARAVRAGIGIIGAIRGQGSGAGEQGKPLALNVQLSQPLQVRIGIHTGLVVAGEMGSGEYREQLAIVGETPNIAARLQEQAQPNSVVISPTTSRLVAGLFECQDLGPQLLKGLPTPLSVYQVVRETEAQSRFEVAIRAGLTPLIGREHEVGLLRERWERAKQGEGQVVLLSGEAGIGKSRLMQELREQVSLEGATCLAFRCSPYYQNSAFYPILEHLQRLLQFEREEPSQAKLGKLQQTLAGYRFPQTDTLALLAALLSLPHPEGAPPLTLSPQRQKQKTQGALVAWLMEEAERAPVYCVWEDLHWADPSTVEVLHLLLAQVPTARMLTLLTFRPEFTPPWDPRSHLTHLTLSRLGRQQVSEMVGQVAGGKALSQEILQQIVAKTDGVPLFVEELTKTVIESVESIGSVGLPNRTSLLMAIPATLHDSLMARLDRLGPAKEIAQLGASLGREFSYELLQAVSLLDEATLRQGLTQLVEAELVYQRGLPPQATYLFKHALIQDAAYQSLLKSTRQQYHQQIAQVLEERFPVTRETQPEILAHHYTEARLREQALPYWQRAGQRAIQRSAHIEAIDHFTKGLELLKGLPDTPERTQQELTLQTVLAAPLMATRGYAAPEVERVYTRARELCQQLGETPQLFRVFLGLFAFYLVRGEFQTARALGAQLLRLAQSEHNPARLLGAHQALGLVLFHLGEFVSAREYLEQGIALYEPEKHTSHTSRSGQDPGVTCLCYLPWVLWHLGYPDRALKRGHEALALAQELSHPFSQVYALNYAAGLHQFRREWQATQEQTEALIALCREQGFAQWVPQATILRGWILAEQGHEKKGIAQMRQGLAAWRATGAEIGSPWFLALLAEGCGKAGQIEEGLIVLTEALTAVDKTGERHYEAELYRLKGQLTLQKSGVRGPESEVPSTQHLTPSTQAEAEAEACFLKALEIARKQQAKSLELRAVMSLSRLWQQQGKREEARQMLAEIYGWFTEGFDTKDLREAKVLLEELSH